MNDIDTIEKLLIEAFNSYSEKNNLIISQVGPGCLSSQFERSNGITLTLSNGKVFEVLITEV